MSLLVVFIVLLPLFGYVVNALFSLTKFTRQNSVREMIVGLFGTAMITIPFILILTIFLQYSNQSPILVTLYDWFSAGSLHVSIAYQLDSLSLLMALIVTGVGSLIHFYSVGYMHGDEDFARFFSYLNLFIFAMLNLILAANLPLMFLGWEGVGLCSYLLIGFWYDRKFIGIGIKTTSDASNKAFIMNRVGDFALLAAMFLIFQQIGSLDFSKVLSSLAAFDSTHLFWITLLIFIGCTGKSAQIPLYTWLPDAMAGPTPVSALIHAATMVTSGIYLIARLSPLFILAPETMNLIAIIGAGTALFAGTIALAQNDIKKVLAYSTVSQLGYMFLALGIGAFSAAIFHVVTHAFFKACLFLGSGSVIHAMHEEQDIRKMGGLRKVMPSTSTTFLIASLALSGIPLTAGFFSKDEILSNVFGSGHYVLYAVGIITAFLTAFYSMRLYSLTFLGERRWESSVHPHESSTIMTLPLWILAAFSILSGFIGLPVVLTEHRWIHSWLATSTVPFADFHLAHLTEWLLIGLSGMVAILGSYFAFTFYKSQNTEGDFGGIMSLLYHKYYIDELYETLFVIPTRWTTENIIAFFERGAIDGSSNTVGSGLQYAGTFLRRWQSGVAQNYALMIAIGLVIVLGYIALKN